jgi:hypothetical protein
MATPVHGGFRTGNQASRIPVWPEIKHTGNKRKYPSPLAENQPALPGLHFTSNASAECSRDICKRYWPPPKSQMVGSRNAGWPVLVPDLNRAGEPQEESG